MDSLHCFPPLFSADTTVLILGSMPGKESLRLQQYYAHPRNHFWQIVMDFCGSNPPPPQYDERCQILLANTIGLWDVIYSCSRVSSLDSDIKDASILPNDFAQIFANTPNLKALFFNGKKAESVFRKMVFPHFQTHLSTLSCVSLPSTSPANAGISYEQKKRIWCCHLKSVLNRA